ncbi:MAG: hypothetical protein K5985_02290 [Lachnospiraceae bacterium]|nr:hypothetical protein [Lachnospiraceae bacterium]
MERLTGKGSINDRTDIVLRKFRARMTSYPPGMCPLVLYRSLLQISMNQSCGKCVPCRDGLTEVDYLLGTVIGGKADESVIGTIAQKCRMIAETSDCAVGIVGANLILDSLNEFADEYESHISRRRCVENMGQTIPCVTLCPAHVDVPGYIAMIKTGDYAGAIKVIRNKNPLPTASFSAVDQIRTLIFRKKNNRFFYEFTKLRRQEIIIHFGVDHSTSAVIAVWISLVFFHMIFRILQIHNGSDPRFLHCSHRIFISSNQRIKRRAAAVKKIFFYSRY